MPELIGDKRANRTGAKGVNSMYLNWFKCDKAWIGLGEEATHHFKAVCGMFVDHEGFSYGDGIIRLVDALVCCKANKHDYELSLTTPEVVLLENARKELEAFQKAQSEAMERIMNCPGGGMRFPVPEWFSCDKGGWIGVEPRDYKKVYEFMSTFYKPGDGINECRLFDVMYWAETHQIPYAISTVAPPNIDAAEKMFVVQKVELEQKQLREHIEAFQKLREEWKQTGPPPDPEPFNELNHRTKIITESQAKLDKIPLKPDGTTFMDKMKDIEFYHLVRNIGKYIVEQERLRQAQSDPTEKAGG
jgi:hypothetical protein